MCFATLLLLGIYDKVLANFSGRVIEVCAKQGALVDKGEPLAYIERCEEPA